MSTQRLRSENRPNSWRDRVRDPALTVMLAVQCLIITFRRDGLRDRERSGTAAVFRHYFTRIPDRAWPIATTLTISAFISDLAGFVLDLIEPSKISLILGYARGRKS